MEGQRKTALITGGSNGIGYELAKIFAQNQHDLIIVARNQDELNEKANEFKLNYGVNVHVYAKDLFKMDEAKSLCEEVSSSGLTVDVLINDAGQGVYGLFKDNDLERELDIIHLNVCATVILTKHFLKQMIERGEGRILNLGSIAGKIPGPWQAVYHATKAFVVSFTVGVREEVKDTGVTLTALLPGVTDTDFFNKAGMNDAKILQSESVKADPADVAKDGYEALMSGDDYIISGFMNKMQVSMANMVPDSTAAHFMAKQQEPVEHN
jgi:short-subunit dehydrogenase